MNEKTFRSSPRRFILFVATSVFVLLVSLLTTQIVVSAKQALDAYVAYAKEDMHMFNDERFTISFLYPSNLAVENVTRYESYGFSVAIGTNYGIRDTLVKTMNPGSTLLQVSEHVLMDDEQTPEGFFARSLKYQKDVLTDTSEMASTLLTIDNHPTLKITITDKSASKDYMTHKYFMWTPQRAYDFSIASFSDGPDKQYYERIINSIRIKQYEH